MSKWDELEIEESEDGELIIVHSGLNTNEAAVVLRTDYFNTDLPECMIKEIMTKMVDAYNNQHAEGDV